MDSGLNVKELNSTISSSAEEAPPDSAVPSCDINMNNLNFSKP